MKISFSQNRIQLEMSQFEMFEMFHLMENSIFHFQKLHA